MVIFTDLTKKHPNKPAYKGFYSLSKYTYQYNGEIVTESFDLDKGDLLILRPKIMAYFDL
jgi:hypothetical protein